MIGKIICCLTGSLVWCGLTLPVKGEEVLARIQRTGVIRVAVREDAAPFGYLNANNKLQGYCLDFFVLLENKLIDSLERNTLSIKLFKSTTNNRFSLVGNNIVDIECGPNTIRKDVPENTSFSTSFFITGTQFLINKENGDRFKLDGDLDEIRLGAIRNTTTEEFVSETYPNAIIQRFSSVTARSRGVQAVAQGKIDAMVSDGILLRAEAQRQELSAAKYPLIPEIPLTCDRYGMIIQNDSQWQDFVNSVIKSSEAVALARAWFGNLYSYGLANSDTCN